MIELLRGRLLAPESFVEDDVGLVLDERDLEDHGPTRRVVHGLEERGHAAAGQELRDLVAVEHVAEVEIAHVFA